MGLNLGLILPVYLILCLMVGYGDCYCYIMGTPVNEVGRVRCKTGGITMAPGESLTMKSKCERCSCSEDGRFHCCAYGIHAGVFAAPSGCKVIGGGADGCETVMVQIADETKLCQAQ